MSNSYTLKKSLGQHFLHDEQMCARIVAQMDYPDQRQLLEIGPGGGAISKYLITKPGIHYKAIEIDTEKVAYLEHTYPDIKGRIINEDILKAEKPFEGKFSIIGNFPYNISSPITFTVLDWEPYIEEVIGMYQKEVAQRIAAGPGSKVYGILSVLTQAYFKVEYLFDVAPQCFTPAPKVMSGVLRLTNTGNPYGIEHFRKFKMLVKAAFNQRRKTLRNALKSILPPAALTDKMLDKRAEQLSVAEFVYLYNSYLL